MMQAMELKHNNTHIEQCLEGRQWWREKKVKDMMVQKRKLVEVPYMATLTHTINALVTNRVVAVPVAAPPGHWIGAGGSMILESDKLTGAPRKHYIGMVNMLDVLTHIAENGDCGDLDKRMSVPVSSIIGHCLEGLSLWTLNPNTSILDCMEVLSKGIHRALVPVDGYTQRLSGAELTESASSYQMLTQMDVLNFLRLHGSEMGRIVSRSVGELGAIAENVFGVTNRAKVIDTIKCMRTASLNAVPIIEASEAVEEDHTQLIYGKGRKLIGTFSATDLRGCPIASLQSCLSVGVLEFIEKASTAPNGVADDLSHSARELVSCYPDTSLAEVIDKAVVAHVHRVWVVDQQGLLVGLVSLTDMLRVIRSSLLSEFGTK
ncbi:PREDICTED: SNF1-related protein kinase regulatory subunit gamma-like PV42a [Nelumbo nucifera]|uniref:SNF1-related protein kinase regulatory subunit gamma-like PV42a n=1 Tax=Nelumbo nucifera TaxID=4432 RepID=A0A1U7YUN4_NELNU|nr:PREDICTED: SNF1-related protein kinase regulatory subunit gamma-like PV42a [Nelumbo nucifera]